MYRLVEKYKWAKVKLEDIIDKEQDESVSYMESDSPCNW